MLAIGQLIGAKAFPILVTGMWAVVALGLAEPGLRLARTGVTSLEEWVTAFEPYVTILGSVFEGQPPLDAIAPTLTGAFAVLAMAAAISFGAMLVTMAAIILAFPLSTALFFLSSSAESVREAERSKTVAVNSTGEILLASAAIARRSRKVFGPRLVVIRVASPVWQDAVTELASLSSVCLIDISQPTENVLWELEELTNRFGDRCVLIGSHERVAALATLASREPGLTSVEQRLIDRIDRREVLAYTTDARGLKRFARALRGLLLTRHS